MPHRFFPIAPTFRASVADDILLGRAMRARGYVVLPHVATNDLAAASTHNDLLDDVAIQKTSITDDGRLNGEVQRFYDNVVPISAAATITLDLSLANWFVINLSATAITTINITNWQASKGVPVIVEVVQDGTGSRSISGWPAAMKGDQGLTTPTITTTANHVTILTLASRDGGTTIRWNYFIANGS